MDKIIKIWIWLFLMLFLLFVLMSIESTLVLAILFLALLIFVNKKFKFNKFPIILFLIALFFRVIICLVIKTEPVSDFKIMLNASRLINISDFSFVNSTYFATWSYQMGFVFYQSLLLKIFDSVLFLKIINCFITSSICVLIYYIAKEFMKEEYARIVSLFYCFLFFPLTFVTVLSNQHFSALLIYLGLFVLISRKIGISDFKRYIISGVLISFGNIIRPEGIITILSIFIYFLFMLKKIGLKKVVKSFLILIVSYYAVFFVISNLFIVTGLSPNGLKNNDPYWKFVLGLNYESVGSYDDDDTYVLNDKDAALELIKERVMVSPLKLLNLFLKKSNIFWNTSTLSWTFNDYDDKTITILGNTYSINDIVSFMNDYNQKCMFIIYILLIIGLFNYSKKKNKNMKILILINQVFVTLGVYLLIEVQPRYAYFIQITTVILMGIGIEYICDNLKNYRKFIKNKNYN